MAVSVTKIGAVCFALITVAANDEANSLLRNGVKDENLTYSDDNNATTNDWTWIARRYQITCCLNGQPKADLAFINGNLIRNWSIEMTEETDLLSAHDTLDFQSLGIVRTPCKRFQGTYLISSKAILSGSNGIGLGGVGCDCPDIGKSLDRNCRYLPPCKNSGYRAFKNHLRCVCREPYFGDLCEKYCERGRRNEEGGCQCRGFYAGEQCSVRLCLNGGTVLSHRCLCPPQFDGFHCQLSRNHSLYDNNSSRFDASDFFGNDPAGTIFSVIMVVVLVLCMYMLVKRRIQMQQQLNTEQSYFDELYRPSALQPPPCYSQILSNQQLNSRHDSFGQSQSPPSYDSAIKLGSNVVQNDNMTQQDTGQATSLFGAQLPSTSWSSTENSSSHIKTSQLSRTDSNRKSI